MNATRHTAPSRNAGRLLMAVSLTLAAAFSHALDPGAHPGHEAPYAFPDNDNWSALGKGIHGPSHATGVLALAVYDGELIAAGRFSGSGNREASNIAKWNGRAWSALGKGISNANFDTRVLSLAVYQGDLYAGGSFTGAGETQARSIARWDGHDWSEIGIGVSGSTPFDSHVTTLAVYRDELIVGGTFTSAGGKPAHGLARWNGRAWSAFPGFSGQVGDVIVHNGDLIVSGISDAPGAVRGGHDAFIRQWNGTTWATIAQGNLFVNALGTFQGDLIVGGSFAQIEGVAARRIARWNGSTWSAFGDGLGNHDPWDVVRGLYVHDGALVATGHFETAGAATVNHIARWNGTIWSALGDGLSLADEGAGPMTVFAGSLIVGGTFLQAGAAPATRIAAWRGHGTVIRRTDIE